MKNKEKVLIYTVFDEEDIDFGIKKEDVLRKYCKDKKYKIVDIAREAVPYTYFQTAYNFINLLKRHNVNFNALDFQKILVYDINEIVPNNASLLSLLTILKESKLKLESIRQGKVNFNPLDKEDLLDDDLVLKYYQCSENEKYFIDSPF